MRGADVASDHRLVRTQIKLKLKKQVRKANVRSKYDVNKLQDQTTRNKFTLQLRNKFAALEAVFNKADIDTKWDHIQKTYNNTAKQILGIKKKN